MIKQMDKNFEKIYSQYFNDVYKFCLSLCQNKTVAEEVTQETFFKALKNIDKYNEQCKFYVWLCQIAKNTYFTIYKKQKNNEELDEIITDDNLIQKMIDKESAMEIYKQIHLLEEPYREIFYLRTFCELSFKDIALIYEKQENWARVMYYRAKLKIKEGLK